MAVVGERPFLELLLRQLSRYGFRRVILAVGYQRDVIRSHFGEEAFGLQIVYSPEEKPLGTGGALRNAADLVRSGTALALNGDSYTDTDLDKFLRHHCESAADMSLVVIQPDERDDCGTVSVDAEGRLLAFQEKQSVDGPKYVNAGIYAFSREMLYEIPGGTEVSLEKTLIPGWLVQGKKIVARIDRAACIDIGTPDRYRDAQGVLAKAEEQAPPLESRIGQ